MYYVTVLFFYRANFVIHTLVVNWGSDVDKSEAINFTMFFPMYLCRAESLRPETAYQKGQDRGCRSSKHQQMYPWSHGSTGLLYESMAMALTYIVVMLEGDSQGYTGAELIMRGVGGGGGGERERDARVGEGVWTWWAAYS